MRVRVLGAAAGGGFPQWNCGCPNCALARTASPRVRSRTQDSLAVSGDGERWLLLNASPDVLRQIEATPELHPRGPRHSPISGILLCNGDLDHTLGLFCLRESQPLVVYATAAVWRGLAHGNAIFRTLERFEGQVSWRRLSLDEPVETAGGLVVTPFAAPGKLPVHLATSGAPSAEDNVAVTVHDRATGKRLVYASSVAAVEPMATRLEGADCVLFDGTFWSDDELVRLGLSKARARDMAHLPIGGEKGSLARLSFLSARRKIYTHINNTNPVLLEDSREREAVEGAGWELATDAMEIVL